jgi:hypothetical protein
MTDAELRRLTDDGRRLLDEAFLRGSDEAVGPETLAEYTEPVPEVTGVDLETLDERLDELVGSHEQHDSALDAAAAPHVHRALDLTRRLASDSTIWHYLAAVRYPHFVRHRWEFTTENAMREKFLGGGKDIYSNALHRLWWIAELSYDGDDYELTRDALSNQTLSNKIFDRWYARYRPAAVVCIRELRDEPTRIAEEVTFRLNRVFTTFQLEGMDEPDVERVVRNVLKEVKAERQ